MREIRTCVNGGEFPSLAVHFPLNSHSSDHDLRSRGEKSADAQSWVEHPFPVSRLKILGSEKEWNSRKGEWWRYPCPNEQRFALDCETKYFYNLNEEGKVGNFAQNHNPFPLYLISYLSQVTKVASSTFLVEWRHLKNIVLWHDYLHDHHHVMERRQFFTHSGYRILSNLLFFLRFPFFSFFTLSPFVALLYFFPVALHIFVISHWSKYFQDEWKIF